jgi:hypothetical protein
MVCLLGGCVPDRPARTPLDALLAETTCGAAVSDLLTDLGAAASYLRAPPAGDGSSSVRVPTARFAEWIAVTLPRDGAPVLSRVTPEAAEVFQFLSDCSHTSETTQSQAGEEDQARFTDEYLLGLLEGAGTAPLVVYVWSPHMPLSPDGWPEIQRAAQIAGMRATPALMAHSDPEFAAREVARVGMPLEGLREIASVELIQRQAQVHAPSIIIFGRDRVSPVLPGYRNTQGYLRYLEAFLEES